MHCQMLCTRGIPYPSKLCHTRVGVLHQLLGAHVVVRPLEAHSTRDVNQWRQQHACATSLTLPLKTIALLQISSTRSRSWDALVTSCTAWC